MIKITSIIMVNAMIFLSPVEIKAEDSISPGGFDIVVDYRINRNYLSVNDTLVINRSLVNNDFFNISGLYFSENIPQGLYLESYSLTKNGSEIISHYEIYPNSIYQGFNTIYWVVDSPDDLIENHINHGDSLNLSISLTCLVPGQYEFPMHTSSFVGFGYAFFTYGDLYSVNYECCIFKGDVNYDNAGPDVSDLNYMINFLFRKGEPPLCQATADINNDNNILIDDLTYLINYLFKDGPAPPPC